MARAGVVLCLVGVAIAGCSGPTSSPASPKPAESGPSVFQVTVTDASSMPIFAQVSIHLDFGMANYTLAQTPLHLAAGQKQDLGDIWKGQPDPSRAGRMTFQLSTSIHGYRVFAQDGWYLGACPTHIDATVDDVGIVFSPRCP